MDEDEEGLTGLCLDRSAASAGNIMFAACRTGTQLDSLVCFPREEKSSSTLSPLQVPSR